MTSPAADDDSTVTPIEAAKPKKETRRQRSARESSERSAAELAADSPVAEDVDEAPVAGDITPKETRVDESPTDEVTPIDDAEDVSDADAGDGDADAEDADAAADADDADDAEDVSDADADADAASDADAGDAAAIPAETRKQRKARQTIEDAKMEMEASEAKAAALAAKQAADAAEKQHAIEQAATMKARVRRGAKRWFRRLALVAVVGGIGVGAYLAWPTFNERYVQPVESTAADVNNIQTNVSALQDLTATENQRLVELINDVNAATDELAAESAAIQDTLSSLASSQADLDARLGDIETEIGNATRRIDEIGTLTTELGSTLEVTNRSAATQLTVMRATELLSRSRLLLYQANYGLAKVDLTAARNALADVPQTPLLDAAIARLDLGISNLPDRPVAAAGDIDIAWAALLAGTTDAVRPDDSFIPPSADQSGDANTPAPEQQADDAAGDAPAESETPDE